MHRQQHRARVPPRRDVGEHRRVGGDVRQRPRRRPRQPGDVGGGTPTVRPKAASVRAPSGVATSDATASPRRPSPPSRPAASSRSGRCPHRRQPPVPPCGSRSPPASRADLAVHVHHGLAPSRATRTPPPGRAPAPRARSRPRDHPPARRSPPPTPPASSGEQIPRRGPPTSRSAGDVRREHRHAHLHRLQHRQAEALLARGHQHRDRPGAKGREPPASTSPSHPTRPSAPTRAAMIAQALGPSGRPRPGHQQAAARPGARDRLERQRRVLVWLDRPGEEDVRALRGAAPTGATGSGAASGTTRIRAAVHARRAAPRRRPSRARAPSPGAPRAAAAGSGGTPAPLPPGPGPARYSGKHAGIRSKQVATVRPGGTSDGCWAWKRARPPARRAARSPTGHGHGSGRR